MTQKTVKNGSARKRKNFGRPTIADVAAKVGVSSITVSRALRDPSKVSQKLKTRINQVIEDINYIADPNAQALASARTHIIGVIIPSLSNHVFSEVLRGIYDKVAGTDYRILIGNSRYSDEEEERLVRLFIGQRAEALIITGIDQTKTTRKLLEKAHCPVVQTMEYTDDPVDMLVGFDHGLAAQQLVQHLMAQGYKRIASINAYMDPRVKRRMQAFKREMQDNGLYDPDIQVSTGLRPSVSEGKALALELLKQHPDVDAIFCGNDDLALGSLSAGLELGYKVPEQLGIAGFHDLEFMQAVHPALTSIKTFRYEMGEQAVDMAIHSIEGVPLGEKIRNISFELVVRQSTRST
ncbi:MAG: LacI family DNA-binding transcriptional regulator [Alphaproteobacteria bacterium]|nr:LacI family DNA-binding transcriptional regulator [Alphaproteobacteria bacterium]